MSKEDDYIEINRKSWNKRTETHYGSDFYDNENFIKGQSSLNNVEVDLLGDVKGKTILHLQCHFGQDTISLSRLGAQTTGVDLSDKAIERAKELATLTSSDATFICCDIYETPNFLDEKFDVVFTSYGTIGWLPDMDKWANVVSHFLKPNGEFIIVEFHPVVWMFDDNFTKIQYNYFNEEAIVETQEGTYADKEAPIVLENVSWNHPISEVVNSLIKNNLDINLLDEHDYSPYNCFNETIEIENNKYRIKHLDNNIPMLYSIKATKK
jgi:ubiquinone/menaquinone biosynthesis C-methylase UbiE